jgi:hypothetical protein
MHINPDQIQQYAVAFNHRAVGGFAQGNAGIEAITARAGANNRKAAQGYIFGGDHDHRACALAINRGPIADDC